MINHEMLHNTKILINNNDNSLSFIKPEYLDKKDIQKGRKQYLKIVMMYIKYNDYNLKHVNSDYLPNGLNDFISISKEAIKKDWEIITSINIKQLSGLKRHYFDLCKLSLIGLLKETNDKKSKDNGYESLKISNYVNTDWFPNNKKDIKRLHSEVHNG